MVNHPDSTKIERFVEKPQEFISNKINAGIYCFNPSILNRIEVSYFLSTRLRDTHTIDS